MDLRVDLVLGGVRTHPKNAVLALKPNLHAGWEMLRDQSGHTNTKVDVETTDMTAIVRYGIGGCDEPEKKNIPVLNFLSSTLRDPVAEILRGIPGFGGRFSSWCELQNLDSLLVGS